jgi:aldehyde dehydrogenase (NAD+)
MSSVATAPVLSPEQSVDIRRVFQRQTERQFAQARTSARERMERLRRLHTAMLRRQSDIYDAMWRDFRKGPTEVDLSEIGVTNSEIRHAIRHLRAWMAPKSVGTPITLFGASSEIRYEPKGVCLIISPWNYPFNLTFAPLVSAIAAGNCVMIKPSEMTPYCSAVMKSVVAECFPEEEVALFEGDVTVSQELLGLPFNHIFFTGSPAVGKIVMREAAKNLSSVTLELGGKSPVIVDASADLDNAAAKIAWLKAMNAGQICIAPDYVLAHESIHDQLVEKIGAHFQKFYGATPEARRQTPDLCRIVNKRHFGRVQQLLQNAVQSGAKTAFGGATAEAECYVEPTVLTAVPDTAAIWEEEIFGPLLPVRTWKTPEEAIAYINAKPKSLAMYIFSKSRRAVDRFIAETRNGNVTVNDCGAHFYNGELPFGGSNNSGIGKSHGEFGFQEFSNARGILRQTRFMPTTDYFLPPYGGKLAAWMLKGVKRYF